MIVFSQAPGDPAFPNTWGVLARTVLQRQHALLLAHEAGVRSREDPEDLHDMRVAARRLRAAVSVFSRALPSGSRKLSRPLGWLARALAEARDRDVLRAQILAWRDSAASEEQASYEEVLGILEDERHAAWERMRERLRSSRYRKLTGAIRALIMRCSSDETEAGAAPASVEASSVVRASWRRVLRKGDALTLGSSAAAFHEFRIRNKRLRDASEFVHGLFGESLRPFLRQLSRLHDALGEQQDATMAIAYLHRLRSTHHEELRPEALLLLRRLERRYEQRGREARDSGLGIYQGLRQTEWPELRRAMRPAQPGGNAMHIYLIRHAPAFAPDAVLWPEDSERPLTPKGRRRWRRAARGLGQIVPDVGALLSSPLSRAWETAMVLHREAGWPAPQRCEALGRQGSPETVVEALREYSGNGALALVGHEPDLRELTSYLLTGDLGKVQMEFKKGGCAALSFSQGLEPGSATLRWVLLPRALRALGA